MPRELHWILLCTAVAAGEAAGFALAPLAPLWPAAALLAVFTALVGYGRAWRGWPFAAAALTGLALALGTARNRQRQLDDILEIHAGSPVTATFTIGDDLRAGDAPNRFSFTGSLGPFRVRVHLRLSARTEPPHPGETWSCTGYLARTEEGPFGPRRAFRVGGRGTGARRLAPAPSRGLAAFRRELSRRLGLGLARDDEAADLNRAMLLGERHRISPDLRDVFATAGTIHIFAISGLHVLLVAHLFSFFLRLLRLPARIDGLLLTPLVWTYVALVGCGPSAVRAALMVTVLTLAPIFWRRPNGFTAWAIAFLLTYLLDPALLLDVGCGLSFAVMLALVTWNWWARPFDLPRWGRALGVALLAWAAGTPLVAHAFGRLTPGGILLSLAILPLASVSVHAAAFALLASTLSPVLAGHLNNLAALTTDLMTVLSRLTVRLPGAAQAITPWSAATCLAWYAAWCAALLLLRQTLLNRRRQT